MTRMNQALLEGQVTYQRFLTLAQGYNFEAAAREQLRSSACHDNAMDAFMAACRLMKMDGM